MKSLALALLACASFAFTDCDAPPEPHAYLVNLRDAPLTYTARWAMHGLDDCEALSDDAIAQLPASAFAAQVVETQELLAQDYVNLRPYDCAIAWITIDGIFDGVVAWYAYDWRDEPDRVDDRLIRHGITVEGSAKKAKLTFGRLLQAFPPPR